MQLVHTALLAFRVANTSAAIGRLSRSLLDSNALHAWAQSYEASCSPEHWRMAERSYRALSHLDLHVVDITQLPLWFRLVRPSLLMLFVRGHASLLEQQGLGIVGTRNATLSVTDWVFNIAAEQAALGSLIISGGALGIDAAAHRGALSQKKPTLAFLGVAIDTVYPPQHVSLFQQILQEGGALVSEHPPLAITKAYDHAKRNRLIAAQSHSVIVAEAPEQSGALITARDALNMGRKLYISPDFVQGERTGLQQLQAQGIGCWQ